MFCIYDDIIYSLQKSGGISVYWRQLENNLEIDENLVYPNAHNNIFYKKTKTEILSKIQAFICRYFYVLRKREEKFIFHSSYYRICKSKNSVNITTLHDFTYELYRKDWRALLHKIQKRKAVMNSTGVICISENTKRDLYNFYPNYRGFVRVIYHGYEFETYKFYNLNRNKTVLFVGARNGYKNFSFAVQLIENMKELNLIIIGGGELTGLEKQLLNNKLHNRYKKVDYISNAELAKYYNTSFALCYPSEYEGFGFPVIEAQACGCPVICQEKSSLPEVSGNCCVYIDSADLQKSINQISKLFDRKFYDEIQKAGLNNVKRFSWAKCAQETQDFYEFCLENTEK